MKESMMKLSLDKDFKDLFDCNRKFDSEDEIIEEKSQ